MVSIMVLVRSARPWKISFLVDLREVSSFVLKCRDSFYRIPVFFFRYKFDGVGEYKISRSFSVLWCRCRSRLTVRILQKRGHYISRMGVVDC